MNESIDFVGLDFLIRFPAGRTAKPLSARASALRMTAEVFDFDRALLAEHGVYLLDISATRLVYKILQPTASDYLSGWKDFTSGTGARLDSIGLGGV